MSEETQESRSYNYQAEEANHGFGIEIEASIHDSNGNLVQLYNGQTINDYIHTLIQDSDFKDLVSNEQIAGHIEFKSHTRETLAEASLEVLSVIQEIRQRLNPLGLEIHFTPVIDDIQKIPASLKEGSRTQELLQRWEEEGINAALAALSGIQVNFSTPFVDSQGSSREKVMERLEIARQLMNATTQDLIDKHSQNDPNKVSNSFNPPLTRYQQLVELIQHSNEDRFREFGYTAEEVLHPPHFDNTRAMLRWMVAFDKTSSIKTPEQFEAIQDEYEIYQAINSKNIHAYTIKIKFLAETCVAELRYLDSRKFKSAEELEILLRKQIVAIYKAMKVNKYLEASKRRTAEKRGKKPYFV